MPPRKADASTSKEKQRLQRQIEEASRKMTILERERRDLEEENARLRERTRLVERIREELSEVNEKLAVLSRLTKEINSLNPEKIFETAGTKIPYIVNARYASVYIYDEQSKKLHLKKHTHDRPIDRVVEIERETKGIMARVLREAKARVFTDVSSQDQDGAHPNAELYRTRSCIVAPLRAGDQVLGILNLADRVDGKPFSEDHDLPLVQQMADLLAISIRNWRLFEQLQRQAKTDSLTKLANHQAFFDDLDREILRAKRYGLDVVAVMLDIDRFKIINDNFGHLAGDFVLEEVARALRATVRLVDTAARYGGDEFALLLPESDLKGALILADRIKTRMQQQRFSFNGVELPVQLSMGIAAWREGESASELVKAADEAMYKAKREGGGKVVARE
jgi:two-component system, cell cycle response regulator